MEQNRLILHPNGDAYGRISQSQAYARLEAEDGMITLIDPHCAHPALLRALRRLHFQVHLAHQPSEASPQGPLVLAGGLNFTAAVSTLRKSGWWRELPQFLAAGRGLLGLGLGMHLLAEGSEEAPRESGLGLLPGIVRRLQSRRGRAMHLGWAQIQEFNPHPVLSDFHNRWCFFAHEYALEDTPECLMKAVYEQPFDAATGRGLALGFQFQPERSSLSGLLLLQTTLKWMGEAPDLTRSLDKGLS